MEETKKKELVQLTLEYFLKYGSKNITMDDIASEFGVSKKTIYTLFKNKDELVQDCISFFWDDFMHDIEGIQLVNPLDKLIKIYEKVIEKISYMKPVFIFTLNKYHKAASDGYELHKQLFRDQVILPLLQQAQTEGKIKEDIDLQLFYDVNFNDINEKLWQINFFEKYDSKIAVEYLIIQRLQGILKTNITSF